MDKIPNQIDPLSPTELRMAWNTGEAFALNYVDLRFHCPCAGCVNEITGERQIELTSISPDIRPLGLKVVGRYAISVEWSDHHSTGMYHFDRLYDYCKAKGRKL